MLALLVCFASRGVGRVITGLSEILPRHDCAWLLDSAFQVAPLTNIQRVSFVNTSLYLQLATALIGALRENRARSIKQSIQARRVKSVYTHHHGYHEREVPLDTKGGTSPVDLSAPEPHKVTYTPGNA